MSYQDENLSTVVNLNNEARIDYEIEVETQSKSRAGSLSPVWSLTLV